MYNQKNEAIMYIENDDFSVWMQKLYAKLEELCKEWLQVVAYCFRFVQYAGEPFFDRFYALCDGPCDRHDRG